MLHLKTCLKILLISVMLLVPMTCNADKYYIESKDLRILTTLNGASTYLDLASVRIDKDRAMAKAMIVLDVHDAPNYMLMEEYFYFDDATCSNPTNYVISKQTFDILDEGPGSFQGRIHVKGESAMLYDVFERLYMENR